MGLSLLKSLYTEDDIRTVHPLSLAYIGDCIYDLYLRTNMISEYGHLNSKKLHEENIKYVNAKAQKEAFFKIKDILNESEIMYFKKGRNCKIKTSPKNYTINDYKIATGFESLIGYLYLTGKFERLDEIIYIILND